MTVKTAISMDVTLFEEAETMASQMKVSRSRLISMALDEFLRRHRNRDMLNRLNAAYADAGANEAPNVARLRRATHRQQVEGTW